MYIDTAQQTLDTNEQPSPVLVDQHDHQEREERLEEQIVQVAVGDLRDGPAAHKGKEIDYDRSDADERQDAVGPDVRVYLAELRELEHEVAEQPERVDRDGQDDHEVVLHVAGEEDHARNGSEVQRGQDAHKGGGLHADDAVDPVDSHARDEDRKVHRGVGADLQHGEELHHARRHEVPHADERELQRVGGDVEQEERAHLALADRRVHRVYVRYHAHGAAREDYQQRERVGRLDWHAERILGFAVVVALLVVEDGAERMVDLGANKLGRSHRGCINKAIVCLCWLRAKARGGSAGASRGSVFMRVFSLQSFSRPILRHAQQWLRGRQRPSGENTAIQSTMLQFEVAYKASSGLHTRCLANGKNG